jgi:septal ring factor EnvC (AmiA/AmiB activator)
MKTPILYALAIGSACLPFYSHADNPLAETRSQLREWVETRQITSKEKADWRTEQAILSDTEALLRSEFERVTAALEELQDSTTAAEEDRSQLASQKETLNAASSVVANNIGALETELKAIIPMLPEPLIQKIKPLIRRLPDDPDNAKLSLGERVQNIVGILSQTDKFNTTITQTSESREIEKGKTVEVRTLYWGLGQAYYVDASAQYAGIGYPTQEGWEWPRIDGAGLEIKRLLDVYEGSETIQFVNVPARIK